jgi:hypothetical protein
MALVHEKTTELRIDPKRSITVIPIDTGGCTLTVEDPRTIAIVEMAVADLDALIEILQRVSDYGTQHSTKVDG